MVLGEETIALGLVVWNSALALLLIWSVYTELRPQTPAARLRLLHVLSGFSVKRKFKASTSSQTLALGLSYHGLRIGIAFLLYGSAYLNLSEQKLVHEMISTRMVVFCKTSLHLSMPSVAEVTGPSNISIQYGYHVSRGELDRRWASSSLRYPWHSVVDLWPPLLVLIQAFMPFAQRWVRRSLKGIKYLDTSAHLAVRGFNYAIVNTQLARQPLYLSRISSPCVPYTSEADRARLPRYTVVEGEEVIVELSASI
ncbi:hypothetical protein WG66_006318 [Moniliophthora roreri]|nr:hypothetical protein WG66_006318 [Moniliophthora roreri]